MKSSDDGLILSREDEELFQASLTRSTRMLYYVQCAFLKSGMAYLASSLLSMYLWHHRLEHLSSQTINAMLHQQMVKGLNIMAPQDFDHWCSSCANGKSHCLLFSKVSQSKYSKIELVIMDLTGPILVPTWDVSQLYHGPVVTYCIVYHYTKRATLARLLANEGPAIYVVYLNKYFVIPPWYYLVVTFCDRMVSYMLWSSLRLAVATQSKGSYVIKTKPVLLSVIFW